MHHPISPTETTKKTLKISRWHLPTEGIHPVRKGWYDVAKNGQEKSSRLWWNLDFWSDSPASSTPSEFQDWEWRGLLESASRSNLDPETLGQVFTPDFVVEKMLSLRKNGDNARTLEPSCGDGAFSLRIRNCVAIELDKRVAPSLDTPDTFLMDFFSFSKKEKFSTIIGNPPYVRFQDIRPETRLILDNTLFDKRSNLFLFFIEKCIKHHLSDGGELIFIVPRDFIKLTAARKLNAWLYEQGSITDFIETGDSNIFGPYVPNCAIFRFEKGRMDRRMHDGRIFSHVDGQLMFLRNDYSVPFSSLFDVRVGAVSGADTIYANPKGNMEFVCSKTAETGLTRRMFFDVINDHLLAHKDLLLQRRVTKFNETNWWQWGRLHHRSKGPRIYVNGKTRRSQPFFTHPCTNYDGSILAIFPKNPLMDIGQAATMLNTEVDWEELGFVCDGRFLFTQRSLQTCMLPASFAALLQKRDSEETTSAVV